MRIEINPHPLGLHVLVEGEETLENTIAYWTEITKALDRANAPGLLLVDRLQGTPLTEQQWLDLVLSMQGSGLERFRIAHVKPLGLQEVEFCQLFARDAGIDARVFADEPAAEQWLAEGRH